jgi:hypothetical protein
MAHGFTAKAALANLLAAKLRGTFGVRAGTKMPWSPSSTVVWPTSCHSPVPPPRLDGVGDGGDLVWDEGAHLHGVRVLQVVCPPANWQP